MNTRVEANRLLGCIKMDEESLRQEIISSLEAAKAVGAEQIIKEVGEKLTKDPMVTEAELLKIGKWQ